MFFSNVIKAITILSVLGITYGQLPVGTGYDVHCLPAKLFERGGLMGHIEIDGHRLALMSLLPYEAYKRQCSKNEVPALTFPVGQVGIFPPKDIKETSDPNAIEETPITGWPAITPSRDTKDNIPTMIPMDHSKGWPSPIIQRNIG